MHVSFCDQHSAVVYSWSYSWYRTKLQTIKSAVCQGSTTLSANYFGQLNHANKSCRSVACFIT